MDRRLDRALQTLPRERAGEAFTDQVLERLERGPRARRPAGSPGRRPPGRWPLLAAAVVLLLTALGVREGWHARQQAQALARLEALQAERQALADEIFRLRRQVAGAQPVYLGGSNDVDLVLDLARLERSGVRPQNLARLLAEMSRPAPRAGELRRPPVFDRATEGVLDESPIPASLDRHGSAPAVRPTVY